MFLKISITLILLSCLCGLVSNQVIRSTSIPPLKDFIQPIIPTPKVDLKPVLQIDQSIQKIDQGLLQKKSPSTQNQIIDPFYGKKTSYYQVANTIFNSQKYFGGFCDRCKKLQYLSFKIGKYYLTAKSTYLSFELSSSPLNSQLFIAEQQVDSTWAFKSLTQGKYISATNDGFNINYQTYVGPWERWYMQRHGNHIHIQSAQFQYYYWISSGMTLKQYYSGASSFVVEHWPKLQWLWNW